MNGWMREEMKHSFNYNVFLSPAKYHTSLSKSCCYYMCGVMIHARAVGEVDICDLKDVKISHQLHICKL